MMMFMMFNDYIEEEIDVMIDKVDLDGDGEIDFEGKLLIIFFDFMVLFFIY